MSPAKTPEMHLQPLFISFLVVVGGEGGGGDRISKGRREYVPSITDLIVHCTQYLSSHWLKAYS